jgi:choice-of-anchor B domain-containing protein
MKNLLLLIPVFLFFLPIQAQQSLDISLLSQWDPDTLPTANGREYNDVWGYVDCDGREYAILGSASRVHFLDLENPEDPQEVASFAGGKVTTWRDMKTYQDRAYAVCDGANEGLMIFDLSGLPDTVVKTYHSQEYFSRAHNIFVDKGKLYVAGANAQSNGMIVLDIATDPDNPAVLASVSLNPGGYVHDVFVQNDTAYCSHGYNGFYIWDFTDPTSPVPLASTDSPGYNHSSWPMSAEYAVFAEEVPTGLPLTVVDLTELDQGNIEKVKTFKEPLLAPAHSNNTPHNPFFRGNYLITSYYEDGLQIFDMSDPLNPERVAYYDTHPQNTDYNGYFGCWGTYPFLPSQLILASDINGGLFVLRADSLNLDSISPPLLQVPVVQSSSGDTLCGDASTLLSSDIIADHYFWYKGDSLLSDMDTSAILVSEAGTYKLMAEKGFCAKVSDPISITRVEAPDFGNWPSGIFLCPDESAQVEAPEGADAYLWTLDGAFFSDQPQILASLPGEYQLDVNYSGCVFQSAEISLSVSTGPNIELAYTPELCEGESQTLSGPQDMLSYQWYQNGQLLPDTAFNITVSESGEYSVSFTLPSDGCTFSSDTASITFFPLPDADIDTQNIPFCPGESGILMVEGAPGASYGWEDEMGGIYLDTNSVEVFEAGEYWVFVQSPEGCIATDTVMVSTFETEKPQIVQQGDSLFSSPGEQYQWYKDGELINGANAAFLAPVESGNYQVEVVDENGCSTFSEEYSFVLSNLAQALGYGITGMNVFPNPVSDQLYVQTEKGQSYQVFNHSGQLVLKGIFSDEPLQRIETGRLPSGMYCLHSDGKKAVFIKL